MPGSEIIGAKIRPRRVRPRYYAAVARRSKSVASGDASMSSAANVLTNLVNGLAIGDIRVIDLTNTLSPDFPVIVLPPEFGQCEPFRMETLSRYDGNGPAWYWNNNSMNEHTGTHFDAPAHWVTGKDDPNGTVDAIAPERFVGPA